MDGAAILVWLKVDPASAVPIYRQLQDQIAGLVAGGRVPAGAFLPSVRQVAEALRCNPMTVSKAWSLLEQAEIVELVRGQGMRVRPRQGKATPADLDPLLAQVVAEARRRGLAPHLIHQRLDQHFSRESHD
jgi:GntR family transcriptional regulator